MAMPPHLGGPERAALAALYRDHHARVRARARHVTGDAAAAEDVVHDVFLRYAAYAQGHEVQRPGALLRQMSLQTALKQVARGAARAAPPRREVADPRPVAVEARLALREVLPRLDPQAVRVAVMHIVDGVPQEAIATELAMHPRAVSRAIAAFCRDARRQLEGGRGAPAASPRRGAAPRRATP